MSRMQQIQMRERVFDVSQEMECLAAAVEAAARRLQVGMRRFPCSRGVLYFCILSDRRGFNLFGGKDGILKCWRLVRDDTSAAVGTCIECHNPAQPGAMAGMKVVEDGLWRIYAQQRIGRENPKAERCIQQFICSYIGLIGSPALQEFSI